MSDENALASRKQLVRIGLETLPSIVAQAGDRAGRRFIKFFTANIRNQNTRLAYARAVATLFDWCDARGLRLETIEPFIVAGYIEELQKSLASRDFAEGAGIRTVDPANWRSYRPANRRDNRVVNWRSYRPAKRRDNRVVNRRSYRPANRRNKRVVNRRTRTAARAGSRLLPPRAA